ncbi:MAG: CYTH domain-containing protein [Acidimicrobiia bacterium]
MSILERELKLDLDAEFDSDGLVGSMGDWTVERGDSLRLDGTYYDTPDLRLLRAGMSLRYRDGWLVKLPQPTDRPELMQRMEVPLEGGPDQVPVEALDLVRSSARD